MEKETWLAISAGAMSWSVVVSLEIAIGIEFGPSFLAWISVIVYFLTGWARGFISASATASISETAPESRMSEAMGLYGSGVLAVPGISRVAAGLIVSPLLILIVPAAVSLLVWKMIEDITKKDSK